MRFWVVHVLLAFGHTVWKKLCLTHPPQNKIWILILIRVKIRVRVWDILSHFIPTELGGEEQTQVHLRETRERGVKQAEKKKKSFCNNRDDMGRIKWMTALQGQDSDLNTGLLLTKSTTEVHWRLIKASGRIHEHKGEIIKALFCEHRHDEQL